MKDILPIYTRVLHNIIKSFKKYSVISKTQNFILEYGEEFDA